MPRSEARWGKLPTGTDVANHFSATVSVIDTSSNTVTATAPVGRAPLGVAATPDGSQVYVANEGSSNVSVIDTATNTVTATVGVGIEPVAFGKFITASTPFAAFSAKVDINLPSGSFDMNGTFTLGSGGSIAPLTQGVTFQSGSFSTTIPGGSFRQQETGDFVFEGLINSVALEAKISPLGGSSYSFKIAGAGASNLPNANPVTLQLKIGNNTGSTRVTADFGGN